MGNQPSRRVTSQDRAILDMKLQRDKLHQYQKKIQVVLDREQAIAREALRVSDKRKATRALRARKYQEQLLVKTDAQLDTLEQLVSNIEFALIEKDVLYGLQQGNQVLKEINKEMSLERVEKLMQETTDSQAYQNEVDEMLRGRLTNADEEDIEDELAALQSEKAKVPSMPDAPRNALARNENKMQKEEEQQGNEETEASAYEPIAA